MLDYIQLHTFDHFYVIGNGVHDSLPSFDRLSCNVDEILECIVTWRARTTHDDYKNLSI